MSQKGLTSIYVILGTVLILIVGSTVFVLINTVKVPYVSPTPTPAPVLALVATAAPTPTINPEWETYTHPKYGFSFKYPNKWRIAKNAIVSLYNYQSEKYADGQALDPGDYRIEMEVINNQSAITLEQLVPQLVKKGAHADKEHTFETLPFGNKTAVSDEVKGDSSYKAYYTPVNNSSILVVTTYPKEAGPDVEAILSSITLQ